MNDNTERTNIALKAGFTGIICNLLLFIFKFLVGFLIHSVSIIADSFNNLSDVGSAAISVVASKMAGKSADEDHPFGHGRIEYIAAFIVSILIISVGINILQSAFQAIWEPKPLVFSLHAALILCISILVKIALGFYYRSIARRIDSEVYAATSQDAFSDALITGSTFVSILLVHFAGWNIDAYIGLMVSLFVIFNGLQVAKNTLTPLIGESINPELFYAIIRFVERYPGVLGTHDLIVHNYGPDRYMATIHVEVDGQNSVSVAHSIIDQIEEDCEYQLGVHLVIHMDPVDEDDLSREYRALLTAVLSDIPEECTFHDFHMQSHPEKAQIHLFFDLVTPWKINAAQEQALVKEIERKLSEQDKRICCSIKLDKPYMHVHSAAEDLIAKADADILLKHLHDKHNQ